MIKYLLQAEPAETRADILDRRSKRGYTPLMYAAAHGFPRVLEQLLKEGAVLMGTDKVRLASACGHHHPQPLLHPQLGKTAMHLAVESGNTEVVRIVVDRLLAVRALQHFTRPSTTSQAADDGQTVRGKGREGRGGDQ